MDEILEKYEIRKRNKQKTEFIKYLKSRLQKSGYTENDIQIEEKWKWIFKTRNIVVGNPETADVFVTAHYDTQAVAPFPNFMFPTNIPLFIISQILLTLFIFGIAWVLTIPISLLNVSPTFYANSYQFILILLLIQIMFGFENKHTANDNTSGTITLVKILENIPENLREKVCVVFFDNEEKGLFGSSFFAKKHKNVQKKLLINIDCVGDGDNIVTVVPSKIMKTKEYPKIKEVFQEEAKKDKLNYVPSKLYPLMFGSDQMNFDCGIGVCSLVKSKFGFLYCGKIHTPFDKSCNENNLNCVSNSIINYIERSETINE